jgi:hypothetical protein
MMTASLVFIVVLSDIKTVNITNYYFLISN